MTSRLFVAVGVAAVLACSGNQLPIATISNVVDTQTMGALDGAALQVPSAFDVTTGFAVRTDQTSEFDFIFTIDSLGRHVLLPLQSIGLGVTNGLNPGLQIIVQTFPAVDIAPTNGYATNDTLVIHVGDVIVARSRVACYLSVPQYAKLHILAFDDSAKTMQVESLSDTNCGYTGLVTGIPSS